MLWYIIETLAWAINNFSGPRKTMIVDDASFFEDPDDRRRAAKLSMTLLIEWQ